MITNTKLPKLPKHLKKSFQLVGGDYIAWLDRRIEAMPFGSEELDRLLEFRAALTTTDEF